MNTPGPAGGEDVALVLRDLRRLDPERYFTALFAPADVRPALFALYAFNLEIARIPEAVSEPLLGRVRYAWWREAVAELLSGAPPRPHAVLRALAATVVPRRPDPARFDRLIAAREADLDGEPPADIAALRRYAEETSSGLLAIAVELLVGREGADRPAVRRAAREVGVAWALTGLVRAIPFHAGARRLYLPADLMAEAELSAESVFAGRASPALAAVVRRLAEEASRSLAAARAERAGVPRAAVPALLVARLADAHLAALRRARCDPFDPRLARPGRGRLGATLAALGGRF